MMMLTGCSGKVYDRNELKTLVTGKTKPEVSKILGTPASVSSNPSTGDETWSYKAITRNPDTGSEDTQCDIRFLAGDKVDAVACWFNPQAGQ